MSKLQDVDIRNIIKSGKRFERLPDGDGLFLCYRERFSKPQWRFRYKIAGKERVMALGPYPATTLANARKMARELRANILLGNDPQADKRAKKRAVIAAIEDEGWTVSRLADNYAKKYITGRKDPIKHPEIPLARINRDIKPSIGKHLVKELKPTHVEAMLKGITDRGAPSIANNTLRLITKILNYGMKLELIDQNVAALFEITDAGGTSKSRSRILKQDELCKFFRAITITPGMSRQNHLTFKLLLLTCVRKTELIQACISEFDLEEKVWYLPETRSKTGDAIDIPLSDSAIYAIKELIVMACGSKYLFPARKVQDRMLPYISDSTLNVALAKIWKHMPGAEKFTVHDLRRSSRTLLSELGVDRIVAEKCLNHKIKGVEGTYDRHGYFDERREALDKLARTINACEYSDLI